MKNVSLPDTLLETSISYLSKIWEGALYQYIVALVTRVFFCLDKIVKIILLYT